MTNHNEQVVLYQTPDGTTELEVRFTGETVWLSQAQMVDLFEKTKQNISLHINNIFKEGELHKDSVVKESLTTAADGKQYRTQLYNLDVVISVGYRVKSLRGTQFRIWATQRLREYLLQGYSIDQQRFDKNAEELQQAIKLIRAAAKSPELTSESGRGLVEIVSRYTQTFLWLQRYDEGLLIEPQGQAGGVLPTEVEAKQALAELKANLMQRGEATELFARERADGLSSILGNLDQTVFGEPAYPSIESKAAHLLYFMVKNHPFTDGNKRSGAFMFVDFLHRNNRLLDEQGQPVINDTGLAALTLLVAESAPEQKETMIRLIMNMLAGENHDSR